MAHPHFSFTPHLAEGTVQVERVFLAPLALTWRAWTEAALLDRWWAPKPWQTVTVRQDFQPQGHWLYYMQGPEGERHYCRADYEQIVPQQSFSYTDSFCTEDGTPTQDIPSTHWAVRFEAEGKQTRVHILLTYASPAALQQIAELGFQEGFTAALLNLDEVLAQAQ